MLLTLKLDDVVKLALGRGVMLISMLLSFLSRRSAFVWSPALDLSDNAVRSTLLPGGQV